MEEAVVYTSEAEFRRWFERNLDRFGIRSIVLSQEVCPDYVVLLDDGSVAKVEAELFAINFRYHKHDPRKVDFIVACYSKTTEVDGVPVRAVHRLWELEDEATAEAISLSAELSDIEAQLLSAIHSSGGISPLAFAHGELAGDQEIWVRMPPTDVAAIPRGRIRTSLLTVLRQETKEWVRKYHHLLIGAGLAGEFCSALEGLTSRGLVGTRPIELAAAIYDGGFIQHPAWLPVEIYPLPAAWESHRESILKYLYGGPKADA